VRASRLNQRCGNAPSIRTSSATCHRVTMRAFAFEASSSGRAWKLIRSLSPDARALKPGALAYYEQRVKALLKSWPGLAETEIKKLSERECAAWADRVRSTMSATTFNHTLGILRNVINYGIKIGARYDNPAQRINVTWADCDFGKMQITVRGDPETGLKNRDPGEFRIVPMIPAMQNLLQKLREEHPDAARGTELCECVNVKSRWTGPRPALSRRGAEGLLRETPSHSGNPGVTSGSFLIGLSRVERTNQKTTSLCPSLRMKSMETILTTRPGDFQDAEHHQSCAAVLEIQDDWNAFQGWPVLSLASSPENRSSVRAARGRCVGSSGRPYFH
jgi:hypothetical protein